MAKALFFSLPLHGHTNPSLPLVAELVRRGEEIVYYSSEPFAARITATGARYVPYRNSFLADIRQLPERIAALSWLLMRTIGEVLDEELEAFRAERPDYLICDSVAPWGACIAQILRIPVVTSTSTFAINRRVLAYGAVRGFRQAGVRKILSKIRHVIKALWLRRGIRRRHGLTPSILRLISVQSDLNIVYTSRYFQPCADSFDERFQFIGPSIASRLETDVFDWGKVLHPVVVYVSLGTIFNEDPVFLRNCFEALRAADCQVILAIGSNLSAESVGPIPANFIVQARVPQLAVLARAAAFITHGGMNSVSESLYHGVPMVVVPQTGEQAIVGGRVEEFGAGLYLAKCDVTADALRVGVGRLLAEKKFRTQAALIRDSFQAAGGVARAADLIQKFTGRAGS